MKYFSYLILLMLINFLIIILFECYSSEGLPTETTSTINITTPIPMTTTFETSTFSSYSSTTSTLVTNGIAVGWIGDNSNGWKITSGGNSYDSMFGFQLQESMYIDSNSNRMYVADAGNNRVTRWDLSSGNALGWIGGGVDGWNTGNGDGGNKDSKSFRWPNHITMASGMLYISDHQNQRISRWESISGSSCGWIGYQLNGWQYTTVYAGLTQNYNGFCFPSGIFVEGNNIYISDENNNRISIWTLQGTALGCIGGGSDGLQQISGFSYNSDIKSFNRPRGLMIYNNFLYVADSGNNRIAKWNLSTYSGDSWIGCGKTGWQTGNASNASSTYNSFAQPSDIFINSIGTIYVTDSSNHRICKWDGNGNPMGWIGHGSNTSNGWKDIDGGISGNDYQSFNIPYGLYVVNNFIYISDKANHRICKWIE